MYALLALLTAGAATLGSLYFQYIEEYSPCDLCWYQRIAIYPLVVIFGIALATREWKTAAQHALPFTILGILLSVYHNIVYYNANFWNPNGTPLPCTTGSVSCSERYVEFAGFITIPFLSLIALLVILGSCIALLKLSKR
jgi:disulfide bond formation protein DsbB